MTKRISASDLEVQAQTLKQANESEQRAKERLKKEALIKQDLALLAELRTRITPEFITATVLKAKIQGSNYTRLLKEFVKSTWQASDLFHLKDENNESLKSHIESLIEPTSIRVTCITTPNRYLEITLRWDRALLWPDSCFREPDFIPLSIIFILIYTIITYVYSNCIPSDAIWLNRVYFTVIWSIHFIFMYALYRLLIIK